MGVSISPSETHLLLTEVDHNWFPTSCDEALSRHSFPALTHPLPPQLPHQQGWEHRFPQLSASRPKQMTEKENSEGVSLGAGTQLCEELQ